MLFRSIYNVLTPSPLAIAASQGNTEMARLLIDHNADVNATSGRPRLPVLMHAAAEGQAGMVKFLIDRGADINAVADNNDDGGHKSGTTALMKAAEKGDSQIVELLIEKGADVNAKNAWEFTTGRGVNIQQATSFAFMSKMDAGQTVNYLFEQVTKEYPAEEFFKPPLLLAIENGNSDIVELLIEKGADLTWVFEPKSAQDWTWPLAPGMNAIMYAAYRGEVKAIEFLISKGLDVNAGDNTKQTALMYAAHQGEAEAVRLLVSKGADMNVRDMENQNALWYAVYAGGVEAVKSLVNSGADRQKVKGGQTALMWAAETGHRDIINVLVELGSDIDAKTKDGATAITYAANAHLPEIIKLLIEQGADVMKGTDLDTGNMDGVTALMLASGKGQTETVRLLAEKGADINSQNIFGATALMEASWFGHAETVKLLIEKGADVNIRSEYNSALNWALLEGEFIIDQEKVRLWLETANFKPPASAKYKARIMKEALVKRGTSAETFLGSTTADIHVGKKDENTARYIEIQQMLKQAGARED